MTTKKTRATPATPTGLRGKELLRAAVNQIIRHPETWDQGDWHCGTSHCIAGHCQILAGHPEDANKVVEQASVAAGLTSRDACWLFSGKRSLHEIYEFAVSFLADRPYFNAAGFDHSGRDRNDFDRDGIDRDGIDRDGFDRDGFDRDGRDRDGRDRDGFNWAGRDRGGRDRDGLDRDGRDRDGRDRDGRQLPLL